MWNHMLTARNVLCTHATHYFIAISYFTSKNLNHNYLPTLVNITYIQWSSSHCAQLHYLSSKTAVSVTVRKDDDMVSNIELSWWSKHRLNIMFNAHCTLYTLFVSSWRLLTYYLHSKIQQNGKLFKAISSEKRQQRQNFDKFYWEDSGIIDYLGGCLWCCITFGKSCQIWIGWKMLVSTWTVIDSILYHPSSHY